MGTFSEWQPQYAEHGIPTFPVRINDESKRPAVSNYLKIGQQASKQLTLKFRDANAIGFALGRKSRITVLDVDSQDERVLANALKKHGPTPIVVRSGNGNHQAWYRHAGESRRIRPIANLPIDILGAGFVVAPPSSGRRCAYQFIQGSLDDVARLPTMRDTPANAAISKPTSSSRLPIVIGRRNDSLFRMCMIGARACDSVEALLDYAMTRNSEFEAPLDEREVEKVVRSAWGYEVRGMNYISDRYVPTVVPVKHTEIDDLMMKSPDAMVLLMWLRRHNWDRDFVVANAMAKTMPGGKWSRVRLAAARNLLEQVGLIEQARAAGRRIGPAVYRWPVKGCRDLDTNTTPPLPVLDHNLRHRKLTS
jgi:hypothetical protein